MGIYISISDKESFVMVSIYYRHCVPGPLFICRAQHQCRLWRALSSDESWWQQPSSNSRLLQTVLKPIIIVTNLWSPWTLQLSLHWFYRCIKAAVAGKGELSPVLRELQLTMARYGGSSHPLPRWPWCMTEPFSCPPADDETLKTSFYLKAITKRINTPPFFLVA